MEERESVGSEMTYMSTARVSTDEKNPDTRAHIWHVMWGSDMKLMAQCELCGKHGEERFVIVNKAVWFVGPIERCPMRKGPNDLSS